MTYPIRRAARLTVLRYITFGSSEIPKSIRDAHAAAAAAGPARALRGGGVSGLPASGNRSRRGAGRRDEITPLAFKLQLPGTLMYATEYAESLRFFASHRYTYGYVLSPMSRMGAEALRMAYWLRTGRMHQLLLFSTAMPALLCKDLRHRRGASS